jgi:hypothetical protein
MASFLSSESSPTTPPRGPVSRNFRGDGMTQPLTELKTRARLLLNASRRESASGASSKGARDLKLRDCLNRVAKDVGFAHWDHGRRVLGGVASRGDDMGSFWYGKGCAGLLNRWYAAYAEARLALDADAGAVLLPYKRQFVLADTNYLRELALEPADPSWAMAQRDLVQTYGSPSWIALAMRRMQAPASTY